MTGAVSIEFARAARKLGEAARRGGWQVPSFRSPPNGPGRRTLRRRGGGAVVAVALHGRPWLAVLADMVEGVVAANGLQGAAAADCRDALWGALEHALGTGEVAAA